MAFEKKQVPTMVKDERLIQKRRDQMIKAAVALFKQKGFHKTTTREIANKAGFSIGTLYEYIRQKEDILYLVCDAIYDQFRERMEKAISHQHDGLNLLKGAVRSYFTLADDMQDELLVMYQESKSLEKESLSYVLKKELDMSEMFEQILERCVKENVFSLTEEEMKATAHTILVLGQMWAFRRWALHKRYTIDQYAELQLDLLLHGLKKNRLS